MDLKETPQEKRERLKMNELKNNATGSLNDGLNRGVNGSLGYLVGMGWMGTGILILVLVVGYVIYRSIMG
ncbi:hypothetical protein D7X33_44105 [Butyricicoccus sp. 1XD8-22]|nr:hypothetical protein D7X33_44105 [Butyricicoccus sp. 1XD8-22]